MNRKKIAHSFLTITGCILASCSNENTPPDDQYINIPDNRFEAMLIDKGIDKDGTINQQMLKEDAKKVISLNLEFVGSENTIRDLTGIEGFTNLKTLYVSQHDIDNIDLSFNVKLETINLQGNHLSSLDLSNNPNVILVDASANELSSFADLPNATQLKNLRLSFNNLEEFHINNTSLESLLISDNLLKSFNVSGALNLKNILVKNNKITTIDISSNSLLETLILSNNKIQHINLEQNNQLTHLYISSNLLSNLDVSPLEKLIDLKVNNNLNLACIKVKNNQDIPTVSKSDYQELNSTCTTN